MKLMNHPFGGTRIYGNPHVQRVDISSKLEASWISPPTPGCLGSGQGNPPPHGPSESGYAPSPPRRGRISIVGVRVFWYQFVYLKSTFGVDVFTMFYWLVFRRDHHVGNVAAIFEHTQGPTSFAC